MSIELNLITGLMLGVEFYAPEDEDEKYLIIDVLFARFIVTFY
jgi:hypothetical protein